MTKHLAQLLSLDIKLCITVLKNGQFEDDYDIQFLSFHYIVWNRTLQRECTYMYFVLNCLLLTQSVFCLNSRVFTGRVLQHKLQDTHYAVM